MKRALICVYVDKREISMSSVWLFHYFLVQMFTHLFPVSQCTIHFGILYSAAAVSSPWWSLNSRYTQSSITPNNDDVAPNSGTSEIWQSEERKKNNNYVTQSTEKNKREPSTNAQFKEQSIQLTRRQRHTLKGEKIIFWCIHSNHIRIIPTISCVIRSELEHNGATNRKVIRKTIVLDEFLIRFDFF